MVISYKCANYRRDEHKCLALLYSIKNCLDEIENLKQKKRSDDISDHDYLKEIRVKKRQILLRDKQLSKLLQDLKSSSN